MRIKVERFKFLRSILILLFFTFLISGIALGISAFIINNRNKIDNISYYEGSILSVKYNEDEKYSLIVLNEYEYSFKITNKNLLDDININDNVKVVYFKNTLNHKSVLVFKLYVNNNLIVDKTNSEIESKNISSTLTVIFIFVSIFSLGLHSYLKRYKFLKEVDYFEYYAKLSATRSIYYLKDGTEKKRRTLAIVIYGIIVVSDLICIGVFGSMYPDYPQYILPPAILILVIACIIMVKLYGYKSYKEKNVSFFVDKFKKILNSFNDDIKYEQFKSDGFYVYFMNVDNPNQVNVSSIISYDDLKFYTYCYFTNDFHSIHIYICSDYMEYNEPVIFKLNEYNYYQIKKNNIKINGLDYLLDNLEKEIIECKRNKIKFKKYK